jgi:chromosome segregation ATPase
MKKTLDLIIIILLLCVGIYLFWSIDQKSLEIERLQSQYDTMKLAVDMSQRETQAVIKEARDVIATKDKEISSLSATIKIRESDIATLSNQLDELQNTEPVAPELEKTPLVINLRSQIGELTKMYSLSRETIAEQKTIIDAWTTKYNLQVGISASWEKKYNSEHQLRILGEELNKKLTSSMSNKRTLKVITFVAVAVGTIVGVKSILK